VTTPLRVLHVEDSENDAELLQIQLRGAGFEVTSDRVQTAEKFLEALRGHVWDVVIADHTLPASLPSCRKPSSSPQLEETVDCSFPAHITLEVFSRRCD
jgi:CheY-like chemotaxis protein